MAGHTPATGKVAWKHLECEGQPCRDIPGLARSPQNPRHWVSGYGSKTEQRPLSNWEFIFWTAVAALVVGNGTPYHHRSRPALPPREGGECALGGTRRGDVGEGTCNAALHAVTTAMTSRLCLVINGAVPSNKELAGSVVIAEDAFWFLYSYRDQIVCRVCK